MDSRELKILTVGNSFGVDTCHHLPNVALSAGFERVKICVLYIPGCSINKHYENALGDLPAYRYYVNCGEGWSQSEEKRISEAVREEKWDFISIQHGSKDGSRYTLPESYVNLPPLVKYIRELATPETKIVFNMAWVMEAYSTKPEIVSYGGDPMKMYSKLVELTQNVVKPTEHLDIVSPTGTAIQNARRTVLSDKLSRDGFHLSYDIGRYIASLTFLKALTGAPIESVSWRAEGVDEAAQKIAVAAANAAVARPFEVSEI